jgi:hypothetical protein
VAKNSNKLTMFTEATRTNGLQWRSARLAIFLMAPLGLAACGPWIKYLNSSSRLVSAAPLEVVNPKNKAVADQLDRVSSDSSSLNTKLEFLGRVVLDSESKCITFVNTLVVADNTVNTTGDILSTLLTAAGTVFTPLNTVHALTASSTVVTGTKTAVNSDIYAKASIANFQTALQGTYFKSMASYTDALPKLTDVSVGAELSKIESIHSTCTLAAAESSIATTISSPAQVPDKPTGLSATPYNGDVELTWTAAANAKSYSVFQGTTTNAESATPVQTGITSTGYSAKNLTNGTAYYFKISAQNGAGSSELSDESTATPQSALANPPTKAPGKVETHATVPGKNILQ